MICITVTPTSRTLAKADLLNAARYGDIIELCLDHFHKEPNIKDLISAVDKPIIISCRRQQDGGQWNGTEEERLLLLRNAIVAGPAYIELDLDIAKDVPRFGSVQRVISFTQMHEPGTDIDRVFYEASNANADVVKFCWPTPTIDAAWPLLAAVSQKRILPVVGMGLGKPELTFSLLGRKYGSPWIYAALEQGMQAHAGQATVFELNETYHCQDIGPKTTFIAIAGFGEAQTITTKILNAAFKALNLNVRCLPIEIGDINRLKKMLDVLKVRAIIVSGAKGAELLNLAEHVDETDTKCGYINLLLKRDDGWHGYNTLWRSALKSLEKQLGGGGKGERPLERLNVLILGSGGIAQSLVYAVTQRKGLVSICGPDDKISKKISAENGCRFVPYQNLYDTLADAIIIADPSIEAGTKHGQINPSVLKINMAVADVSNLPLETYLLQEARERRCNVVDSRDIFKAQLNSQFKAITGKEIPKEAYQAGFDLQ